MKADFSPTLDRRVSTEPEERTSVFGAYVMSGWKNTAK